MANRTCFFVSLLGFFICLSANGQNGIIGNGFGTNDWSTVNCFSDGAGGSRIFITTANGTGNQFFRLVTCWAGNNNQWGPIAGADLQITPGILTAQPQIIENSASHAYYFNVPNASHNYIFKTRQGGNPPTTRNMVVFQVAGTVRTVTNVTRSSAIVAPGQTVAVTATLSGNLAAGQGVYLRYTNSNFDSSMIVPMTGAGTTYTANIPGGINLADANISYYVFTSGAGLTITHANADLYTINQNNNAGANYGYVVQNRWRTVNSGDWNTPSVWESGSVPAIYQNIEISAGHVVNVNISSSPSQIIIQPGATLNGSSQLIYVSGGFENYGTFNGQTSTVIFEGLTNYVKGNPVSFFNLTIGDSNGNPTSTLFIDDEVIVLNNLHITTRGILYPGSGGTTASRPTIRFTGNTGNLINNGEFHAIFNSESLLFSFEGETFLNGNGGLPADRSQFSDIVIIVGALLSGASAGTINIELLNGTLLNNGSLFFGDGTGGIVNTFIAPNQTVDFNASDALETIFYSFEIGTDALLRPVSGEVFTVKIDQDLILNNNSNLQTGYNAGKMNIAFTGINGPQKIIKTSNTPNSLDFQNLIIETDTALFLEVPVPSNFTIFVSDTLDLRHGLLVTLETAENPIDEVRYKVVMIENSVILFDALNSETHVAGPLTRLHVGADLDLSFPMGQGNAYRRIDIEGTRTNTTQMELTAEVFARSSAALNHDLPNAPENILNISTNRFWVLFPDNANKLDMVQVTLHYGGPLDEGVTHPEALRALGVNRLAVPGSDWSNLSPNTGGSGLPGSIQTAPFNWTSSTGFDFTLGNVTSGQNPLPVTWLDFYGRAESLVNKLFWTTATEQNNDYFEIQRSQDGQNFVTLGFISGNGTTNTQSDYQFSDDDPLNTTTYYRLVQHDFDGAFDLSKVIAISRNGVMNIYPNPFDNELRLVFQQSDFAPRQFNMYDVTGRLIASYNLIHSDVRINTTDLIPGIYIGIMDPNSDNPHVLKLVKQK